MSDGMPGQNLAKPTVQVHRLWYEQQIAEKKEILANRKAEAERLIQGTLKGLEAECIMLEREVAELMRKKDLLETHGNQDVIDIKLLEQ